MFRNLVLALAFTVAIATADVIDVEDCGSQVTPFDRKYPKINENNSQ